MQMNLFAALLIACSWLLVAAFSLNAVRTFPTGIRRIESLSAISFERESVSVESVSTMQPLIYLPGLDGVGSYSLQSFANVSSEYDVWKLQFSSDDRSTFLQVSEFVLKSLQKPEFSGRNITLVGESCGALFASHVALRSLKQLNQNAYRIHRVVLVNPATSFEQTGWSVTGRVVASSGPLFPVVGLATLLATAIEVKQITTIGNQILSRVTSTETLVAEMESLLSAGQSITRILPPDTLRWRLSEWLERGNSLLNDRLVELNIPSLILVGKNDRLLPSRDEGRRLARLLPNAELKEFDSGHALLDGSVDLAKELRMARIFRPSASYTGRKPPDSDSRDSSYLEFPVPSDEEMAEFDKSFMNLMKPFSPVFLSRDERGRVQRGLGGVPTGIEGRPVLLVGNHQLFGGDLGLIIRQFITEKKTLPRGLAHPMVFQSQGQGQSQGLATNGRIFLQFGAVEVSPLALYDLLSRNETVLLFPGGVNEAFHGKDEQYKVFWPKNDFVRMAAVHKAIIVPFGAVGMADSVNMVLDAKEMVDLPFGLGDRVRQQAQNMPQARAGGSESMVAPLIVPSIPQRNYFLFQKPIDTAVLCPDISDKQACKDVYAMVKQEVESSIQTLLEFRETDPFKDTARRLLFETVQNQQAPTGNVERLNK